MPAGARFSGGGPVDYASVRWMAKELGQVPIELRRELRPRIRTAGEQLRSAIKSNASWSSRIPGSVRMTVSFSSKNGGVRIWVDGGKSPHARPIEHLGQPGTFRHPVYGNRNVWVSQAARPFFFPAIKNAAPKVRSQVEDAVRASFPKGMS